MEWHSSVKSLESRWQALQKTKRSVFQESCLGLDHTRAEMFLKSLGPASLSQPRKPSQRPNFDITNDHAPSSAAEPTWWRRLLQVVANYGDLDSRGRSYAYMLVCREPDFQRAPQFLDPGPILKVLTLDEIRGEISIRRQTKLVEQLILVMNQVW